MGINIIHQDACTSSVPCIEGPDPDKLLGGIDDVLCMRISQRLTYEHLFLLRASLLDREGDEDFLLNTMGNYSGFTHAEFAFVVMHEWKKRSGLPTLKQLYRLMVNADIDKHVFCRVWFTSIVYRSNEFKVTPAVHYISKILSYFCFIRYQTSQNVPSRENSYHGLILPIVYPLLRYISEIPRYASLVYTWVLKEKPG